jgi:hypothetical protein
MESDSCASQNSHAEGLLHLNGIIDEHPTYVHIIKHFSDVRICTLALKSDSHTSSTTSWKSLREYREIVLKKKRILPLRTCKRMIVLAFRI